MIKQNNFSDNRRRTLPSGMSEEELKELRHMLTPGVYGKS